jgi:signal transduction histidine kinase
MSDDSPSPAMANRSRVTGSVSGQLLVAALAHLDRADEAEREVARMAYLTDLENRLLGSLEAGPTDDTVAHVVLPELDAWTVVDVLEPGGRVRRLALVHSESQNEEILNRLDATWTPDDDDPIGLAAARRLGRTAAIVDGIDVMLQQSAHSAENLAILRDFGVRSCLIVPMWRAEHADGDPASIDGAITFLSRRSRAFTAEEIAFAERVTHSCGRALRNTRLFAELTEQRLIAERAHQSTSSMLGHVTHELRTPLAAIGGYAELLEMGVRGPVSEAQQQDLQRIRWNQQHLLSLITQILSFVRADTGRTEFSLADVDLGLAMREVTEMLEPLINEKHRRVRLEGCAPSAVMAFADPDKVRQIGINLITNALKYSPDSAEIVLRCGTAGGHVFAEVEDHGAGIASDQLDAIFLPFVQLKSGAAERAGGVGLGLSIARQLAVGMRGDLSVRSTLGRGSTFRMTLPAGGRARRSEDRPT